MPTYIGVTYSVTRQDELLVGNIMKHAHLHINND